MKIQIVRRLGAGGFGIVDLVVDENGQQYACKRFSDNQPLTAEIRANVIERFRKEARVQKSISHQNIVPVIYDAPNQDPPFYLMPVAEGSLDRDIAADRNLGGNYLAAISDIVAALEEIHTVEIFHRDLKPQNVLRYSNVIDGESIPYYAISDFGLISLKESQLSVLTSTGMAKGSDHYTAPEITSDLRKASVQSDIYSLGCILHDMIGVAPRVPCAEIKEDGPYGPIMRACTRFDPKKRFTSARSVLDALVSVGIAVKPPETRQAAQLVQALDCSELPLPPEIWIAIAELLDTSASEQDQHAICAKITSARIEELHRSVPQVFADIAARFSDWVWKSSFNFDYCDGISNRLETFIRLGNFDAKVECLLAMLEMGTSHNRWYVERTFARICSPEMDSALAKRLAIEFRVRDDWICGAVSHLEKSIGVNRSSFHPDLIRALSDICLP